MKIFNWVHSRFNNKEENVKKNGDIAPAVDEQFPAENKCSDVFERWGGEILAIGTFGYDPLKVGNEQVDGFVFEDDDDDNYDDDDSSVKDKLDEEDEEQNLLVLDSYNIYNAEEAEMEENWKHEDEDDHDQLQFGFEYVMMKKKERTTLADLFNADSDHDNGTTTKKQTTLTKPDLLKYKFNRKSFGNKINAKDVRPIHKLNQLMRRMLKRKIHPDAGPTNSKVAVVNNNNNNIKCRTSDDYASLLPTQDGNI